MTLKIHWKDQYQVEIDRAQEARLSGNEGMARVCARRAVGILLGEYLSRQGVTIPGPSAYDRIRLFQSFPNLPPHLHETISHFLLRVSLTHTLPENIDLIAEAEWLQTQLLD